MSWDLAVRNLDKERIRKENAERYQVQRAEHFAQVGKQNAAVKKLQTEKEILGVMEYGCLYLTTEIVDALKSRAVSTVRDRLKELALSGHITGQTTEGRGGKEIYLWAKVREK